MATAKKMPFKPAEKHGKAEEMKETKGMGKAAKAKHMKSKEEKAEMPMAFKKGGKVGKKC